MASPTPRAAPGEPVPSQGALAAPADAPACAQSAPSPGTAGTSPGSVRNAKPRSAPSALWVSSTYFAEGYPYSIVNNLAEVLFAELGASLRVVGLTALFHLPWNLKFLWGPLLDQYETKRRWLIAVEVVVCVAIGLLVAAVSRGWSLGLVAALFVALAFASATHDIAIDGFYLEGLDTEGQSRFVGYRAMAYKLASLVVRGPLVIVAGWVGWAWGLGAALALMLLLTVLHATILPRVEERRTPIGQLGRRLLSPTFLGVLALLGVVAALERQLGWAESGYRAAARIAAQTPFVREIGTAGWIGMALLGALVALLVARSVRKPRAPKQRSHYGAAFGSFLAQPRVGVILAFVVLFRAGESMLQKMKWPFLRDVVHLSLDQYGFANGTLGVVASFVGTLAGGWLIARQGLRRWIWPFVLAQNVLNLLYAGLGWLASSAAVPLGAVTTVISLEHFGEGLGTAVFMVFLMRCCDPEHKAGHMALLTALMSVSFTIAGAGSGYLAQAVGFVPYFALSFAATIPAMVLIAWLPYLDGRSCASSKAAAD